MRTGRRAEPAEYAGHWAAPNVCAGRRVGGRGPS